MLSSGGNQVEFHSGSIATEGILIFNKFPLEIRQNWISLYINLRTVCIHFLLLYEVCISSDSTSFSGMWNTLKVVLG